MAMGRWRNGCLNFGVSWDLFTLWVCPRSRRCHSLGGKRIQNKNKKDSSVSRATAPTMTLERSRQRTALPASCAPSVAATDLVGVVQLQFLGKAAVLALSSRRPAVPSVPVSVLPFAVAVSASATRARNEWNETSNQRTNDQRKRGIRQMYPSRESR